MYAMKLTSPFATPSDENGEYIIYPTGATNIINPFINAAADNKDLKTRINGTFYGIVKIPQIPGLEYRLNLGNDFLLENYYYSSPYDANLAGADRKHFVSGKRVSVRVDMGGRRSIKKEITKK